MFSFKCLFSAMTHILGKRSLTALLLTPVYLPNQNSFTAALCFQRLSQCLPIMFLLCLTRWTLISLNYCNFLKKITFWIKYTQIISSTCLLGTWIICVLSTTKLLNKTSSHLTGLDLIDNFYSDSCIFQRNTGNYTQVSNINSWKQNLGSRILIML